MNITSYPGILRTLCSVVVASSLLLQFASAETLDERDFKQLRADRDKAAEAALDPINRRYKEELEKLFKRATQAAELALAQQIQAELQAVGGAGASKAVDTSAGNDKPSGAPMDKSELKKFIENSVWKIKESKGDTRPPADIVFQRNGQVIATKPGDAHFYALEAPDIVKLYKNDPKRNPKETYYGLRVNMNEKTAQQEAAISTKNGNWFLTYSGPTK